MFTFQDFKRQVNRFVENQTGLSLDDLPDAPLADYWHEDAANNVDEFNNAVLAAVEDITDMAWESI